MTAPLPPAAIEERRIAALHALGVLDTPPEERFDRLTRLAARLFDAPIALVSLVDVDRQWWKSCTGDVEQEILRAHSFCARTILGREPLVVPDATLDPRFADNPYVTQPDGIRFYAGQPLHAPGGEAVGTFCVADTRPREVDDEDLAALADLARLAEAELNKMDLARAERVAAGALAELELILDAAGEGILRTDAKGRILFANPAACRLLGYTADALAGHDVDTVLPRWSPANEPIPPEESVIAATLRDGEYRRVERLIGRADGSRFHAELTVTAIREGRRLTGTVIVLEDETDKHEVNRIKDELTSVVGHELRTPLTSIRGSLGLVAGGVAGELPDQARRLVATALSNSERLARLIDDILDLERLRSGELALDLQEVRAADLVAETLETVAMVVGEATVAVRPEVASGLELRADPLRIVQALTNLVGNAIKFSPAGSEVVVRAALDGDRARFDVVDRGRGIPPEELERIFERFAQVDAGDARERGGTGLGLAIARTIAQHHGGDIRVASEPGRGSTFTLTVPLRPEAVAS